MDNLETFLDYLYEDAMMDTNVFDEIYDVIQKNDPGTQQGKRMRQAFLAWYKKTFGEE